MTSFLQFFDAGHSIGKRLKQQLMNLLTGVGLYGAQFALQRGKLLAGLAARGDPRHYRHLRQL